MASEEELLAKLERWLARKPHDPTLSDVLATGDGELFAAFVLKGFRVAAKQAVLDRFDLEASDMSSDSNDKAANAAMRVFDGLSRAWSLTQPEQLILLGLEEPSALATLRSASMADPSKESSARNSQSTISSSA